jgi:imidazolonepropionase-like amidohydrolase
MSLCIHAGRILTGDGTEFVDGAVLIEGGEIAAVGPAEEIPEDDADRTVHVPEHTLLPGLVDAHTHFSSLGDADRTGYTVESTTADRVIHTVENARRTVDAGITTVRDVGSPGDVPMVVRDAIEAGIFEGPRVVTCGQGLTATGGHGSPLPPHLGDDDIPLNGYRADGIEEVLEGVRTQLARGADAIKVWATGGVIDPEGEIDTMEYSQAELDAIVAEADRHNVHVAAHAHPPNGIQACVDAGVRSIEHGMYMDDAAIEAMAENDVYLVSTLSVMHRLNEHPDVPQYYRTNTNEAIEHHMSKLPDAVDAGVPLAMGTDAGAPTYAHGGNADELAYLVESGLSPADVIEIATRQSAELLEFNDLGVLEPGYKADCIAVRGDPTRDIEVLTDPENVQLVVSRGTVIKDELVTE